MKTEAKITRRSFIKKAAMGATALCVSKIFAPADGYAKTADDTREIRIIDAHAHPDRLNSNDTTTDSLQAIKVLGMVASVFAAVGDSIFLSKRAAQRTSEYDHTMAQLNYWLSGIVQSSAVKLVLTARDIPARVDPIKPIPGAILSIEGGDALQGNVARVNEFYELGVRLITVIHYRNNELGDTMMPHVGGPSPGPSNGGLTPTGRAVIEHMRKLGMVVDVAHADHTTLQDILAMRGGPIIDSHTSLCVESSDPVQCGLRRLRTWQEMEAIAKAGGIVCNWPKTTANRNSFKGWASELFQMKQRLGIEHLGIGTDGGGSLPSLIQGYHDVKDLTKLIAAMEEEGFTVAEIAAVMGGNFERILKESIG